MLTLGSCLLVLTRTSPTSAIANLRAFGKRVRQRRSRVAACSRSADDRFPNTWREQPGLDLLDHSIDPRRSDGGDALAPADRVCLPQDMPDRLAQAAVVVQVPREFARHLHRDHLGSGGGRRDGWAAGPPRRCGTGPAHAVRTGQCAMLDPVRNACRTSCRWHQPRTARMSVRSRHSPVELRDGQRVTRPRVGRQPVEAVASQRGDIGGGDRVAEHPHPLGCVGQSRFGEQVRLALRALLVGGDRV